MRLRKLICEDRFERPATVVELSELRWLDGVWPAPAKHGVIMFPLDPAQGPGGPSWGRSLRHERETGQAAAVAAAESGRVGTTSTEGEES